MIKYMDSTGHRNILDRRYGLTSDYLRGLQSQYDRLLAIAHALKKDLDKVMSLEDLYRKLLKHIVGVKYLLNAVAMGNINSEFGVISKELEYKLHLNAVIDGGDSVLFLNWLNRIDISLSTILEICFGSFVKSSIDHFTSGKAISCMFFLITLVGLMSAFDIFN